jgi:hypothetical protein
MAVQNRHHGVFLPKTEETQDGDNNDDETNDVDNVVHA